MITRDNDYTYNINNAGHVTFDTGEYDYTTIQAIGTVVGVFGLYGTLDGNSGANPPGKAYGNAALATNFTPIQATNLATGTAVTTIGAAGLFSINNRSKYVQISGGTSIYKLIVSNRKID